MATEIERKYLITGNFREDVDETFRIKQGYLSRVPERTVRIRTRGEQGFITVKGLAADGGISRYEWEMEIPLKDAEDLLLLCEPGIIDKTRHIIYSGNHKIEVDEFHGENAGLMMAEIELATVDEAFEKPDWLGAEVSGDPRYYNANLAILPYKDWLQLEI